ncbi:MAG: hypothetical protein NTY22_00640 [Proteobacteria bacterium]|nr:hypothetical protein [Pseudomonadota bacterium]
MGRIIFIISFLTIFFMIGAEACEQSKTFEIKDRINVNDNTERDCRFKVTYTVSNNSISNIKAVPDQEKENEKTCLQIGFKSTPYPSSMQLGYIVFVQWYSPQKKAFIGADIHINIIKDKDCETKIDINDEGYCPQGLALPGMRKLLFEKSE